MDFCALFAIMPAPGKGKTMKSSNLLDRKGNFRVAFYHGTSSLFADSIKELGLGGRDPVKTNGWAECFGELFRLADQKLSNHPKWQEGRENLLPIVEQGLSNDGLRFNFAHGETYITPHKMMAEQYGLQAGCEILDYIKTLSLYLHSKGQTLEVNRIVPVDLQQILIKSYRPILVKINGLRFRDIDTENGDDKWEVLYRYEEYLRTKQGEKDMTSWKLNSPVAVNKLEFYEL
tara:strand:+ start:399 stop:1094 length:696 start_codon:yes stop_codon:yes gene_type:complete